MAQRHSAEAVKQHHFEHGVYLEVDGREYCGLPTSLRCDPGSGFTDVQLGGGEVLHIPSGSEVSAY